MRQTWGKLLFMHWAIDPSVLRPLIPAPLSIDTFENQAWIGVVPFTMWGIRASFLPPIPGTSAFHELNVRTYVHLNEIPGVWFFSLDAAHRLAVWGARTFYYLPYFNAEMHLEQQGDEIEYSSKRTDAETYSGFFEKEREVFPDLNISELQVLPRASLSMKWNIGEAFPVSTPGSIGFFLTERYCLYSVHHNRIYRSRIFHEPWSLRRAKVCSCASTMIQSLGIPQPAGEPLLHYAEAIDVNVWPLQPA
jgi:uncharacterized protein YqjF (DUF2071 family)